MDSVPNFTPRAQEAIKKAREFAAHYQTGVVKLEHLLLGLLAQGRGLLREAFSLSDNDLDGFRAFVETALKRGKNTVPHITFAAEVKTILELAYKCATDLNQPYVGTEHMLLSIIKFNSPSIQDLFQGAGVNRKNLTSALRSQLLEAAHIESIHDDLKSMAAPPVEKFTARETFGINYNELARRGKFDDVVCQEESLLEITESLCRKGKNNPLLLGEPGVGKTALIEGLSRHIVSGACAEHLIGHSIFGLDLASMIAGTKYRGQFEERLKNLLKELQQVPNLILFIDEIHTLVGAGSAEGTMDAANILKPTLARGEIRCIGATTFPDYKKTIEKDGALARRFQPIILEEPSISEAKRILYSLKGSYEDFHYVSYENEAIDACVELSVKYIHDRHLPDKAIDLLDQAGSRIKISHFKRPKKMRRLEEELEGLMEAEDVATSPLGKDKLLKAQDKLFRKYRKEVDAWSKKNSLHKFPVQALDIQRLVASKIGVPVDQVSSSLLDKLLSLEDDLNKLIIGQKTAIKSLTEALVRNKAGLKDDRSPIGSFMLLGASGTGKTLTARILAKTLFGSKDNFIKINMTEYSDSFTSSKLIGAAPGYVGYEQAGQLTEAVRGNPYSVVLFDEVEKAHENVTQMLLQILDEGLIRDSMGREINFRNCIIIITGNVGAAFTKGKNNMIFSSGPSDDHETIRDNVVSAAQKHFRPEFLNRLDEILVFNNFTEGDYERIIELELSKLKDKLKPQGLNLAVYKTAKAYLRKRSQAANDGARPIERLVQTEIANVLARSILEQEKGSLGRASIKAAHDELIFEYT